MELEVVVAKGGQEKSIWQVFYNKAREISMNFFQLFVENGIVRGVVL